MPGISSRSAVFSSFTTFSGSAAAVTAEVVAVVTVLQVVLMVLINVKVGIRIGVVMLMDRMT